jgi:hypothetical protein
MAKWSGVYLEDCHKLLKKIEKELEKVAKTSNSFDVLENERYLFVTELQAKIKKWRREMFNEEGEK